MTFLSDASQVALVAKNLPASAGDVGSIPGLGKSPGEGNGYPFNILAWRIPWAVSSKGSQRVGCD